MSERLAIHAWGFFADDGTMRMVDGASVSAETPREAHERVVANVTNFGGQVMDVRTTRTLDGCLVGTEFVATLRSGTNRMWHRIFQESDAWPNPLSTTKDPRTADRRARQDESEGAL